MKWLIKTPLLLTFLAVPATACAQTRPARVAFGYRVEAPHYSAYAWRHRDDFRRDARDTHRNDYRPGARDAHRNDYRPDARDAHRNDHRDARDAHRDDHARDAHRDDYRRDASTRRDGAEARQSSSRSGRHDARPAAPRQHAARRR